MKRILFPGIILFLSFQLAHLNASPLPPAAGQHQPVTQQFQSAQPPSPTQPIATQASAAAAPGAPDPRSSASPQPPAQDTPPTALTPADAQKLLQKLYMTTFRISDLLTLVNPANWKMDDTGRKAFDQNLSALRDQLKLLEQWRYQLASQPRSLDLGDKTIAAASVALAGTESVSRDVSQYDSPGRAANFKQAAAELTALKQKLESYLDSQRGPITAPPTATAAAPASKSDSAAGDLETETIVAPSAAPAAADPPKPVVRSAALQTETLAAPTPQPPPATTTETPETTEAYQTKLLMHKIYVATYRATDLLTVVHPESWKTAEAARTSFTHKVADLRAHLSALEKFRSQLEKQPQDTYLGFETYMALNPVVDDMRGVTHDVGQFGRAELGVDLKQAEKSLEEAQTALRSYLDFILQTREQALHGYQADLATCQNTLNYAMGRRSATPMPNIMPTLKGVHARRAARASEAPTRSRIKKRASRTAVADPKPSGK